MRAGKVSGAREAGQVSQPGLGDLVEAKIDHLITGLVRLSDVDCILYLSYQKGLNGSIGICGSQEIK